MEPLQEVTSFILFYVHCKSCTIKENFYIAAPTDEDLEDWRRNWKLLER